MLRSIGIGDMCLQMLFAHVLPIQTEECVLDADFLFSTGHYSIGSMILVLI